MMKKKKAKTKKLTKAAPKRRSPRKKPKDVAEVRKEIAEIVKENADEITVALVDQAIHGQSAQAKYLFEMAKIFPVVEGEESSQEEDCLTQILLSKLQPPKKNAEENPDPDDEDAGDGHEVKKPEGNAGSQAEQSAPAHEEESATVAV